MKHALCLILALVMLCGLCGCHYREGGDILEPVEFYFPRKTESFIYGSEDGVIASEIREASGHVGDLKYLLTMYLYGPLDSTLRSGFPAGCTLLEVRTEDDSLYVRLSEEFTKLENSELTIACAALARTCFSMTDVNHVCIDAISEAKTVSMTLDKSTILYADYSVPEVTAATEAPQ